MAASTEKRRHDYTEQQKVAFGQMMREARQKTGLTQREVSAACLVESATISKAEHGAWLGMDLIDIGRLVRYYKLDMAEVLTLLGLD